MRDGIPMTRGVGDSFLIRAHPRKSAVYVSLFRITRDHPIYSSSVFIRGEVLPSNFGDLGNFGTSGNFPIRAHPRKPAVYVWLFRSPDHARSPDLLTHPFIRIYP